MPVETQKSESATRDDENEARSLRRKQIFVVVLAIGLVIALFTQPDSEEVIDSDMGQPAQQISYASSVRSDLRTDEAVTMEVSIDDAAPSDLTVTRSLQRWELSAIFGMELLKPDSSVPKRTIEVPVPRVQAVYGSSAGKAALIGRSIIRSGHDLPGGGTVLGISEDGIHVDRD